MNTNFRFYVLVFTPRCVKLLIVAFFFCHAFPGFHCSLFQLLFLSGAGGGGFPLISFLGGEMHAQLGLVIALALASLIPSTFLLPNEVLCCVSSVFWVIVFLNVFIDLSFLLCLIS